MRHHVRVRLDLVEQAALFQPLDDRLARCEAVEPVQSSDGLVEFGADRGTPRRKSSLSTRSSLRFGVEHIDHAAGRGACRPRNR